MTRGAVPVALHLNDPVVLSRDLVDFSVHRCRTDARGVVGFTVALRYRRMPGSSTASRSLTFVPLDPSAMSVSAR